MSPKKSYKERIYSVLLSYKINNEKLKRSCESLINENERLREKLDNAITKKDGLIRAMEIIDMVDVDHLKNRHDESPSWRDCQVAAEEIKYLFKLGNRKRKQTNG